DTPPPEPAPAQASPSQIESAPPPPTAQPARAPSRSQPHRDIGAPPQTPATFAQSLTLSELGLPAASMLRGTDSTQHLRFFTASDRLVKLADLKLRFRSAPGLIADTSHLIVSLNGTVVGTLP